MIKNYRIEELQGGMIRIIASCIITKQPYSVTVLDFAYTLWQSGSLIQDAIPNLSSGDREFLISGVSPDGWDKMFPKQDSPRREGFEEQ